MHMFEIYREYLDSFSYKANTKNLNFQNKTITSEEISKFLNTLHFGREGKLYFPPVESAESGMIEEKLEKLGLIQNSGGERGAALQVIILFPVSVTQSTSGSGCRCPPTGSGATSPRTTTPTRSRGRPS